MQLYVNRGTTVDGYTHLRALSVKFSFNTSNKRRREDALLYVTLKLSFRLSDGSKSVPKYLYLLEQNTRLAC